MKEHRHLDAIRLADTLRKRLVDFTMDDQYVRDEQLRDICKRIWEGRPEDGGLISDLWVEGAFAAKSSGETLRDLVEREIFNRKLCAHLDEHIPADRPLYLHQREAIVRASRGDNPAMLITASTGAGKTEAFLLPMLNELYTRERRGRGVQCIILYPMNALVNDQVERLYELLQKQSHLKLFHFTSETPERIKDIKPRPKYDSCRIISRQQARGLEDEEGNVTSGGAQPDILITNYSMLEYMLCRPQDSVFFGSGLRCLILDEAHLYTGTLAAEITLLFRRLLVRCGVKSEEVMQIATSATIGRDDNEELRSFASTIFSKPIEQVEVIVGEMARVEMPESVSPTTLLQVDELVRMELLTASTISIDKEYQPSLAEDRQQCEVLESNLPRLVGVEVVQSAVEKSKNTPAILLYYALRHSPIIQRLEEILWRERRLRLSKLASELWGDGGGEATKATLKLLQMGAAARLRVGDLPLLPHRIHLLVRSAGGLGVCVNPACTAPEELKLDRLGAVTGNVTDRCRYCNSVVLSIVRCSNCGEWLVAGTYSQGKYSAAKFVERSAALSPLVECEYLSLERPEEKPKEFAIDPSTGERTYVGTRFYSVERCQRCGVNQEMLKPFVVGRNISLSIISEAILSELPEYPSKNNIWLPARGRRLLAFSDSRSSAAKLGPSLSRQHELQLIRAALATELRNSPVSEKVLKYKQNEVTRREVELEHNTDPTVRTTIQRELEGAKKELRQAEVGRPLREWVDEIDRKEREEAKDSQYVKRLHELVDLKSSVNHQIPWSQEKWEDNYKKVLEDLEFNICREIARRASGQIMLESIGLAEITYPGLSELTVPDELLGQLPTNRVREAIKSCWLDYLAALCDTLRSDGVCTLGNDEEDLRYHTLNLIGKWASKEREDGRKLVPFIGGTKEQLRRYFTAQILVSCGVAEGADELAITILRTAFHQLLKKGESGSLDWVQVDDRETRFGSAKAIRLNLKHLAIRSPLKVYRCQVTGHIWPRSVLGFAPETRCRKSLVEVTQEELDRDPRVGRLRSELQNSEIFKMGLWAEEHSAQLAPSENRRIQDLFKAGVRNILSSTTTLELGIDIGGLNAVLMSNVPPGKASYLQRSGRAGRRADGSSIVVTFSRHIPFDREVFNRFGDYLDRPLKQPVVLLDRERIARRHFNSFMLGEFFRELLPKDTHVGAMTAYGKMGRFTARRRLVNNTILDPKPVELPAKLPEWLVPKGNCGLDSYFLDFLRYVKDSAETKYKVAVKRLFEGVPLLQNTDWEELLCGTIKKFQSEVKSWCDDYDEILCAWQYAEDNSYRRQVKAITYQLELLYNCTVIEALSDHQVLPRYGFPVNVHRLKVVTDGKYEDWNERQEDRFRLERGGVLALREYIPGSQLIAGGRIITSRGLLKHWTGAEINQGAGLRWVLAECERKHTFYGLTDPKECVFCSGRVENRHFLLIPSHGFSTAAWDPPRIGTEVRYVGRIEQTTISLRTDSDRSVQSNFASIHGLTAVYQEGGEILVFNRGKKCRGFIICSKCGYTESESKNGEISDFFRLHPPLNSNNEHIRCLKADDTCYMRHMILGARECTDLLLLDFSGCLSHLRNSRALVYTLTYALKIAGARLLNLDTRELGVLVVPTGERGEGLGGVVYDNMPGGAGHVLELRELGREWLELVLKILYVDERHHKICKSSCLDCLLTFDSGDGSENQMCRELAYGVLEAMLRGWALPTDSQIGQGVVQTQRPQVNPPKRRPRR